jgi:hypothetical protein
VWGCTDCLDLSRGEGIAARDGENILIVDPPDTLAQRDIIKTCSLDICALRLLNGVLAVKQETDDD